MVPLCSAYSAAEASFAHDAAVARAQSFSQFTPSSTSVALPLPVSLQPAHGAPAAAAASAAAAAASVLLGPTPQYKAEDCSICSDSMDPASPASIESGGVFTLSCHPTHSFHLLCLSKSLGFSSACPLDRSEISRDDLSLVHGAMHTALAGSLQRNKAFEKRLFNEMQDKTAANTQLLQAQRKLRETRQELADARNGMNSRQEPNIVWVALNALAGWLGCNCSSTAAPQHRVSMPSRPTQQG